MLIFIVMNKDEIGRYVVERRDALSISQARLADAWLRFFRVVNLPTVPGDVLVGAAAVLAGGSGEVPVLPVVAAAFAACGLYLFGLADNDVVGAPTDVARPIPEGLVSLRAARVARGLCLFGSMILGAVADLPPGWWIAAFALAVAIVVYNRTKACLVMGLCRGLNVLCGAAAVAAAGNRLAPVVAAVVWILYIAGVTAYSVGEEDDPEKRRRVGFLVGAIVYLQLLALMVFAVKPLLVAGAVLLVILRFVRRQLPKVSAS